MTGNEWYPPPGAEPSPPQAPPPGWAGPPPPSSAPSSSAPPSWAPPTGWAAAPGMLGAAHKPGAMPLRPLGLGDIYDAAFKIIRFNPKATVGAAVLVGVLSTIVPVLTTTIISLAMDVVPDGDGFVDVDAGAGLAEAIALVAWLASYLLGGLLYFVGSIFVTGMVAHVTAAAAIGRRLSLGEAWAATRGTRWRLIGLTLLLGVMGLGLLAGYVGLWVVFALTLPNRALVIFGVFTVPMFLALMIWWWVRVYYLSVPALALERMGVLAALGRAFRLTRRQFWRTFGIALLTVVVTSIASQVLTTPLGFVAQIVAVAVPEAAVFIIVLSFALTWILSSAFVTPFTSAVTALQYLDQRIRKEAYDVELMSQAGITGS